jgi:hypothetical protein
MRKRPHKSPYNTVNMSLKNQIRRMGALVLVLSATVIAWSAHADGVRAQIRTRFDAVGQFPGFAASGAGGGTSGGGCPGTVILLGDRLVTNYPNLDNGCPLQGGWISDFSEEKTYRLNPNTREYTVQSFSDVRRQIAVAHGHLREAMSLIPEEMPTAGVDLPYQTLKRAKRFEYTTALKETGQKKQFFGYEARQLVLTVTAIESGKALDADGGWVVTSTIWLGPRLQSLDALVTAMRRYSRIVTKGLYDTSFTQIELPMGQFIDPIYPEHAIVGSHVIDEMERLGGTVLASISDYEIERTAKEWKSAQDQYAAQHRRLAPTGVRVLGGGPPKRTRLVTIETEFLSLDSNVTDADVSIPTGFRKK